MIDKTKIKHLESERLNLPSYLERVNYNGTIKLNFETIKNLMLCQLYTVPFENLDTLKGKALSMLPDDIVDKIINKHRGGGCFELSGLFALVLQEIGVPYIFVAARSMVRPGKQPNTHIAIIATIENENYLIDLGFGSHGIREPLKLSSFNSEVQQGVDRFIFQKIDENEYILKALVDNEWANQYSFEVHHQEWIDFLPGIYYNTNSTNSFFIQKPIIVILTKTGRKILNGNTLKIIENKKVETLVIEESDFEDVLKTHFNLQNF
ncbi:MAG: arylamine N-acetyltransferase [Sediminibacterium sp.]|nr:arylamine N-acetyltransferase [Sediminibacterium sp.]